MVFDFTADYTAAGPERFLQGCRGYRQADALAQHEGLYGEDKIRHVCCWAHARRKFVAALEGGEACAQAVLAWIGQLYAIECELPLLPASDNPDNTEQRRQREEQRNTSAEPPLCRVRRSPKERESRRGEQSQPKQESLQTFLHPS